VPAGASATWKNVCVVKVLEAARAWAKSLSFGVFAAIITAISTKDRGKQLVTVKKFS